MKTCFIILTCALLALIVLSVACTSSTTPVVSTTLPTYTPFPTYTPNPTYTPLPSLPTYTPDPTYTPNPTYTPFPSPTRTPSPTPTPTRAPTEIPSKRYTTVYGIDYTQPAKYLAQGEQTRLSNPAIINSLRGKAPSVAHLGEIYFWIKREFTTWTAGGATIGIATTDKLFAERRLGGCHDWALVYASITRELGYPTVMIDTAGIGWAKRFLSGQKGSYTGHVFVEVFLDGKWILIDSTNNWYVETNYDPANGIIPLQMGSENEGLYVMRKAADTWGYGIRSNGELTKLMEETARTLKIESIEKPPYKFLRFK